MPLKKINITETQHSGLSISLDASRRKKNKSSPRDFYSRIDTKL